MPLVRASRGGWWADAFTLLVPCGGIAMRTLYDTVFRAAEGFTGRQIKACDVDRPLATVWYGRKQADSKTVGTTLEGANGRQEQRPGRDLAKHDRRDGEGIQLLRQSGDGLAGILQGRQPGRRGHRGRAKAARRSDGEISGRHESAEPGADGRHG